MYQGAIENTLEERNKYARSCNLTVAQAATSNKDTIQTGVTAGIKGLLLLMAFCKRVPVNQETKKKKRNAAKRNKTKRNQTKRKEMQRNKTKRKLTKRKETKRKQNFL
jgi:hypothetical protein